MDANLTFWRVGWQETYFIFPAQAVVFPVECKTGRLRSDDTRLIRSVSKKLGAPFSVIVTSETFDFSDPSILRVPAFMLYAIESRRMDMGKTYPGEQPFQTRANDIMNAERLIDS